MSAALWIARGLEAYALIGFAFAIVFVAKGAAAIDPAVRHSPLAFRLLLLPGSAVLWPLLLVKWAKQ